MSLLTAQQVRNHSFTTVRFKEGYDVEQVDEFLDQVEATLRAREERIVYLEGKAGGSVSETDLANQDCVDESSSSASFDDSEVRSPEAGNTTKEQISWEQ
ncbi:DivIVA domain-containing protein [Bifidobacterium sp. ESL0745]|uniref:DivIVA domain-containing protein n=1 Tax=Bifidobacterium sp. ESL0745 TaxID=2983226 RepID=UPI0023F71E83|nr:DivIVA domain-containing protein [Bifidobacterium sp. ESL0745]MDF7664639.1 DivIVA domain-containing protein [Bifidobacterium sp. ESL0745]